jgi:pyrimidine deaminase RibD-like protein
MDADIHHMRLAIREARRSIAEDATPHPYVGVVVVRDNEVLATACRGDRGLGDHAEFGVLEKKLPSEKLSGCTIYTTLEPCTTRNHPKVPCADRLIERRVGRVVIGMLDPDQRITGRGILRLRRAGIAVDLFPPGLMAELEELNRDFIRDRTASGAQSRSKLYVRGTRNPLRNPVDRINLAYADDSYELEKYFCAFVIDPLGTAGVSCICDLKRRRDDVDLSQLTWYINVPKDLNSSERTHAIEGLNRSVDGALVGDFRWDDDDDWLRLHFLFRAVKWSQGRAHLAFVTSIPRRFNVELGAENHELVDIVIPTRESVNVFQLANGALDRLRLVPSRTLELPPGEPLRVHTSERFWQVENESKIVWAVNSPDWGTHFLPHFVVSSR